MTTREKIQIYIAQNPGATYRQIMQAVGLKSTSTVAFHLDRGRMPPIRERLKNLRQENDKFREALQQIASCTSHHKDDVVAIARRALALETGPRLHSPSKREA
jgi:hypothetical protein